VKELNFEYLPLDEIDISLSNVRRTNLAAGIDELASSIKEIGVQQPVVVFPQKGRYELVIGQRRYLACRKLGLQEIPALISEFKNETQATLSSFSENIHRLDLEYRDKMQVATELLNKFGSIEQVATHLGVSPQTVRSYLGYAAVPESIKKMVDEKKLSASTAARIAKYIPDEKQAVKIAEKIKETLRSEQRRNIIDVARENPTKPAEEIVKIARETRRITIHVTRRVYEAIILASKKYETDKEDIAREALEDWLKKRGFIE